MKLDRLSFREAVDKLLGSTSKLKRASAPVAEEKETLMPPKRATQLLERVLAIYEKTFIEVPEGRAYLEKRGITDAGLFTQHRLGYSNGRLKEILPTRGQIWNELKALGVLLENGHERFTGCVVVPVCNENGNLVTLYGRYTGEGPRRHVFLSDRSTGLWNAAAMKTYSEIILFEETPETIEADIGKLIKHCEQASQTSAETLPPVVELMPACVRREAEEFGRSPELIERLRADFEVCGLVGEKYNKWLCYLALVSRKTDAPLSVLILSSRLASTNLGSRRGRFFPFSDSGTHWRDSPNR